jgi:hypothetical protein
MGSQRIFFCGINNLDKVIMNFFKDYSNREKAYVNLLGQDYDIKHLNRIEAIWATNLSFCPLLEKYLIRERLLPSAEIENKVLRFWYERQGLKYKE